MPRSLKAIVQCQKEHLLCTNMLQSTSTWNFHTYACVDTTDCQGTQELFVVNSVKLHLTAFIINKKIRKYWSLIEE